MGKLNKFLIFFIISFLLLSCSSKNTDEVVKTEDAEQMAYKLFEEGKYNKALDYFLVLRYEKTGKERAKALFYIGNIYFKQKDWNNAIETFKDLLGNYFYDGETYNEPAAYMMSIAYYKVAPKEGRDMTSIDRSIDGLSYYLQMFPNGAHYTEIAEKKNELEMRKAKDIMKTGDFYFNRKEYEAAKVTYAAILEENPDFILEDEVLYKIAICYLKEGEKDIAETYFDRIDEDSPYYKKLEKVFE